MPVLPTARVQTLRQRQAPGKRPCPHPTGVRVLTGFGFRRALCRCRTLGGSTGTAPRTDKRLNAKTPETLLLRSSPKAFGPLLRGVEIELER